MQLWTHHPSNFAVDTAAEIDPTKGQWWTYDEPDFRYRQAWPELCKLIGTCHFLWCCCKRGVWLRMTEEDDCVEWQIESPPATILTYYSTIEWDKIVRGGGNWRKLLLPGSTPFIDGVGALVVLPLPPGSATCLGPLPVKYPKGSIHRDH
jgi:hypothetical protein